MHSRQLYVLSSLLRVAGRGLPSPFQPSYDDPFQPPRFLRFAFVAVDESTTQLQQIEMSAADETWSRRRWLVGKHGRSPRRTPAFVFVREERGDRCAHHPSRSLKREKRAARRMRSAAYSRAHAHGRSRAACVFSPSTHASREQRAESRERTCGAKRVCSSSCLGGQSASESQPRGVTCAVAVAPPSKKGKRGAWSSSSVLL